MGRHTRRVDRRLAGAGGVAEQLSGRRALQGTARAKARGRHGRKVLEGSLRVQRGFVQAARGNGGREAGDLRTAIAEVREDFVDPGEAFACHCEVLKASFISFVFLQGDMVCVCIQLHVSICVCAYPHMFTCTCMRLCTCYTYNLKIIGIYGYKPLPVNAHCPHAPNPQSICLYSKKLIAEGKMEAQKGLLMHATCSLWTSSKER